jgi:hypothetical protein
MEGGPMPGTTAQLSSNIYNADVAGSFRSNWGAFMRAFAVGPHPALLPEQRLWGGDLIGMTAMPEAKLVREAEIGYALLALVTDYDCWRNKNAAAGSTEKGAAVAQAGTGAPGVGGDILLAEITAITPQEVNRLAPLWMKYFEPPR